MKDKTFVQQSMRHMNRKYKNKLVILLENLSLHYFFLLFSTEYALLLLIRKKGSLVLCYWTYKKLLTQIMDCLQLNYMHKDFLLKHLKFIRLDTKQVAKSQDQCSFEFLGLSDLKEFCKAQSFDPCCLKNYINDIFSYIKRN